MTPVSCAPDARIALRGLNARATTCALWDSSWIGAVPSGPFPPKSQTQIVASPPVASIVELASHARALGLNGYPDISESLPVLSRQKCTEQSWLAHAITFSSGLQATDRSDPLKGRWRGFAPGVTGQRYAPP